MNGRTVVATACALCAACSLFLDTGDFSGESAPLDGGAETSAPPDASPEAGGERDAAQEANAAEAGPVPSPDGGFCDSFERTTVVGPWGALTDPMKGCTLSIDGTVANEGTSSLKLSLAEKNVDDCPVFLGRNFDNASPAKISVSFDLRVSAVVSREVQIASFTVTAPDRALYLYLGGGALRVAEQEFGTNAAFSSYAVSGVDPGGWHRVELTYEIATKHVQAKYDDIIRLDRATSISYAATGFFINIGTQFIRAGAPGTVWFDDYRFVAE